MSNEKRKNLIKNYLSRLCEGESLESVRADFVEEFAEVDASEIMQAEQELLREGIPLAEVQRLCDVHSALFHGKTREEQSPAHGSAAKPADYSDKHVRAENMSKITGHPIRTLTRENSALSDLLEEAQVVLAAEGEIDPLLEQISEVTRHYAQKGDLLYPHLKVKYGISGPSDVMWTTDGEIRDELSRLRKTPDRDNAWKDRVKKVLTRINEMIYKEQNILFPICAVNFTEEEWKSIYRDSQDYEMNFGVERESWQEAESGTDLQGAWSGGEVVMPGGHMTVAQLTAMLNTIPLEITFVDEHNINRYFNDGPKVFKRPAMAIDREVFSCHPPKVEPMVRAIIESFRNGQRDSVPIWMDKGGRTMLVTYMAVRDQGKNYLGTMEIVQDMEFAKEHFGLA